MEVAEGGVEFEDEGRAEGIEGFGAVELDCDSVSGVVIVNWSRQMLSKGWRYSERDERWESHLLKPTPGFGEDTNRCSYVLPDEYPLANRKPAGRICEDILSDGLNACILTAIN